MSVDFSEQIDHFLNADLGEEVRGDLVAIAQALQDAINAQLIDVDATLTHPGEGADAYQTGIQLSRTIRTADIEIQAKHIALYRWWNVDGPDRWEYTNNANDPAAGGAEITSNPDRVTGNARYFNDMNNAPNLSITRIAADCTMMAHNPLSGTACVVMSYSGDREDTAPDTQLCVGGGMIVVRTKTGSAWSAWNPGGMMIEDTDGDRFSLGLRATGTELKMTYTQVGN